MDKILTVNDVAEILQVKPITVREMFREKRLRAFKVGKAWRTTEEMLEQDIDAMACGKSPATLAQPSTSLEAPPKTTPPKPRRQRKSSPSEEVVPPDQEDEDKDSQQLLF